MAHGYSRLSCSRYECRLFILHLSSTVKISSLTFVYGLISLVSVHTILLRILLSCRLLCCSYFSYNSSWFHLTLKVFIIVLGYLLGFMCYSLSCIFRNLSQLIWQRIRGIANMKLRVMDYWDCYKRKGQENWADVFSVLEIVCSKFGGCSGHLQGLLQYSVSLQPSLLVRPWTAVV